MKKLKKEESVLYAFIGEKGRGMCNTAMKVRPYKSDFMLMVERESRKQTIKDVLGVLYESAEYYYGSRADRIVTNHREKCGKWTKEFCLDCIGGGTKKLILEYSKDLNEKIKKLGVEKNG